MSSESTLEKEKKKKGRTAEPEPTSRDEEDDRDEDEDDDDDDETNGKSSSPSKEAALLPKEKVILDRPGSAQMIWTIMRRELGAYFTSPITYIVGSVSFLVFGLWFFFSGGTSSARGFWQLDRASMQRMFDTVPAALCLIVPLFTMRTLSDEKRVGTIELLITMPVKDSEVILGKYFAALSVILLQLAMLVLYPIVMFKWPWHVGELDWNAYWVGMLGLVLLSAAATAIGMMWSAFTESQLLALFGAVLTLGVFYAIGFLTLVESLQGWPGDAIAFISLQTRFDSFARGVFDTRAVIYFLSLTSFPLLVAFRSLESRKWA